MRSLRRSSAETGATRLVMYSLRLTPEAPTAYTSGRPFQGISSESDGMIETHSSPAARPRALPLLIWRLLFWACLAALAAVLALQLFFFVVHAGHLLRYRYPLDYGEGP